MCLLPGCNKAPSAEKMNFPLKVATPHEGLVEEIVCHFSPALSVQKNEDQKGALFFFFLMKEWLGSEPLWGHGSPEGQVILLREPCGALSTSRVPCGG